jgi:hypothetical protein
MTEYDQNARYAVRRIHLMGALRFLIGEPIWSAWRWKGWLDTQSVPFPGEPDRRFDTAFWLDRPKGDAPPLAVVIEFMSRPRQEALERLCEYTLRVRRELPLQRDPLVRFDVVGILVNLTGEMASGQWGMTPLDTCGLGLSVQLGLRNLATISAHEVLAGVRPGQLARVALVWVPLMAGADEPGVATDWAELAGAELDAVRHADLGGVARVFVELADRRRIWGPVLEGWNVERSQFLDEVREAERVLVSRAAVVRVLRRRLGGELPAELGEVVQQQKDLTTLEQWLDQVATISSLAEARGVLGVSNGSH